MHRTTPIYLVLVALLVLSDCNALGGGDSTPIPVTPADVPTEEPRPTPVSRLAPGLTQYGVVDPYALSQAHDAILNNTSYTYVRSVTKAYPNGTLRARRTHTTRVVDPTGRFYTITNKDLLRVASEPVHRQREIWSDGTVVLMARTVGTNTTYQQIPVNLEVSNRQYLSSLFLVIDTRVVDRTTRNGTTLYRLEATNVTHPSTLFELATVDVISSTTYKNLRNVTFSAVIDSHGLVHEYRLTYTSTLVTNGRNIIIRTVISAHYTKIGTTTVERPAWYAKAVNQTTPVNRTTASATPTD